MVHNRSFPLLHTLQQWSALAVLALVCLGCATPTPPGPAADSAAPSELTPFSRLQSLDPAGPWVFWTFHRTKTPTRFQLVNVESQKVIEARADRSIAGLRHRVDVDPAQQPILEWRWRANRMLDGADLRERHGDDSPVRIVLAFEGDRSTLPPSEQAFFERIKLLGGQDLPYATLMYVWCPHSELESVVASTFTTRVQKIVVEQGPEHVGQWRSYQRDIVADYRRAYGKEPGRLISVGIMSDTDNTRESAQGWFGDIHLRPRAPQ